MDTKRAMYSMEKKTLVLSIFKSELNLGLNVLPEFEVLMQFNGSLNVNLNFKHCLMPKWE